VARSDQCKTLNMCSVNVGDQILISYKTTGKKYSHLNADDSDFRK
jgi:hypothetical protein